VTGTRGQSCIALVIKWAVYALATPSSPSLFTQETLPNITLAL
jgi:hypothetical protein